MKEIAKMWAVPISVAENFYPVNKPAIQVDLLLNVIPVSFSTQ